MPFFSRFQTKGSCERCREVLVPVTVWPEEPVGQVASVFRQLKVHQPWQYQCLYSEDILQWGTSPSVAAQIPTFTRHTHCPYSLENCTHHPTSLKTHVPRNAMIFDLWPEPLYWWRTLVRTISYVVASLTHLVSKHFDPPKIKPYARVLFEEPDIYLDNVIKVVQWCDLNALILNTLKTEIIFGATQDTYIALITSTSKP